jgi:prevent-host-death family protein
MNPMVWSLSQAQDQLEDVLAWAAQDGPQIIDVDGNETVLVVSKSYYDHLCANPRPLDFKDFLKTTSENPDHSGDGPPTEIEP